MSGNTSEENTVLGRIASVYGVKGWVKIYSSTDPIENILTYSPWLLKIKGQWKSFEIEAGKRHGKGLVAKLVGADDREIARLYNGVEIAVESHRLPQLEEGEFYWSQLENLTVYTVSGQLLGKVSHLMETGANDVIVVRACEGSLDREERLIPYMPETYVVNIDLEQKEMVVNWDPEF